jgi:4-aminobutyrate aminotransferase
MAAHLGERCLEALAERCEALPLVGDVRGIGLLLALELVVDRSTKERAVQAAERVMYECLSRGLSFKVSHGNCLVLTPPLTISRRDLERALRILIQVLLEVAQEGRPATFPVDRPDYQEGTRCR